MSIRVIPTGLEYDIALTNAIPYNTFEYSTSAFELAEKVGGKVVEVYSTSLVNLCFADPENKDECEFEGYGVLIDDDWGDPVFA